MFSGWKRRELCAEPGTYWEKERRRHIVDYSNDDDDVHTTLASPEVAHVGGGGAQPDDESRVAPAGVTGARVRKLDGCWRAEGAEHQQWCRHDE